MKADTIICSCLRLYSDTDYLHTEPYLVSKLNIFLSCHSRDFGSLSKDNVYENNRLVSQFYNSAAFYRLNECIVVFLRFLSF